MTFTLENYERLLRPGYLQVIWTTLRVGSISTLLAVLFGYPLAYHMARSESPRTKKVILIVVMTSFMMGSIIRVYSWMVMFYDYGVINKILRALNYESIQMMYTETAIIISVVTFLIPFATFTLVSPIKNASPSLTEAAESLGASKVESFIRITFPLTLHGIAAAVSICFAMGVTSFTDPLMLGGGIKSMVSVLIFTRFLELTNFPFGGALAAVLLGVATTSAYGINKLITKFVTW